VDTLTLEFSESTMAKKQGPYAPEFRRQMIELVRPGLRRRSWRRIEPSAQAIRNWVAQADRHGARCEGRGPD
jgi:transposase